MPLTMQMLSKPTALRPNFRPVDRMVFAAFTDSRPDGGIFCEQCGAEEGG